MKHNERNLFYFKYYDPRNITIGNGLIFSFLLLSGMSMFLIGLKDSLQTITTIGLFELIGGLFCTIMIVLMSPIFPHEIIITTKNFKWNCGPAWIAKKSIIIPIEHFESILLTDKEIYLVRKNQFTETIDVTINKKIFSKVKLKAFLETFRLMKIFVGKYGQIG